MVPLAERLHLLCSPSVNFSNKSMVAGVMTKGLSDTDAPKPSSSVDVSCEDVVTLGGDPASPPPHPPCPSTAGSFSRPLTEMGGHVGQRHGVHLFGDCLIAFVARGGEVDVQVAKKDG